MVRAWFCLVPSFLKRIICSFTFLSSSFLIDLLCTLLVSSLPPTTVILASVVEKMSSYQEKNQDAAIQGVLVQEIPGARAVQKVQGDADVELASGVMKVLLVTLDVGDPFQDDHQSQSEKARAFEPES